MRPALAKLLPRDLAKRPDYLRGLAAAVCGVGVGVGALLLYLRTLAPTVLYFDLPYLRDAAVLQVKAAILGIPDYTGYPTFVLLGKLFTLLPFGDVAYRANLSSAVYAAVAVALIFVIGWKLSGRVLAAAVGAVVFAVGKTLWSQAVIAEVYTLNVLFICLTLLTLLVWRDERKDRYLLLAAFLMGLSLTDHLTSGLLLPFGALFVYMVERSKLRQIGLILKGAGCFVVGLLPYAFIPIRASMDYLPEGFEWGSPMYELYPPNTFTGFYLLVSGGPWKGQMLTFGPLELVDRGSYYATHLVDNFPVALLVVAAMGLWVLFLEDRAAAVLTGGLYGGWLFYALEYDIEDIHFYFIPTYLLLSVFLAVGLAAIMNASEDAAGRFTGHFARLGRGAAVAALSLAALAFALWDVDDTYRQVDRSEDYRGRKMIETVAEETKPDAAILHHRSSLNYMYLVEKRRTDIRLVNYVADPRPPGIVRAIRAKKNGLPVYILFPGPNDTIYFRGIESEEKVYGKRGYDLVPVDRDLLLYEVVKAKDRT